MDELNLLEIENKLKSEFESGERIVFWYDADASFEDSVDQLQLGGVTKDDIIKCAQLINDEKATVIIEHVTYSVMDDHYGTDVFTEPTIRGKLGTNAMKANKHLYDHIVYDSTNERDFAADLDTDNSVAVYVKLPDGFYISTPVGHYNPDWAVAFREGTVKHIYFVAETKGSMSSMQLRLTSVNTMNPQ